MSGPCCAARLASNLPTTNAACLVFLSVPPTLRLFNRSVDALLALLFSCCRGHDVLTVVPRYAPYQGVEPTGISVPLDLPPPSEQPPPQPQLGPGEALPPGPPAAAAQPHEGQPHDSAPGSAERPGSPGPAAMEDEGVGEGQDGEGAAASGAGGLPQHADLWACEQGGVQRVFVDHPLFASTGGFGW